MGSEEPYSRRVLARVIAAIDEAKQPYTVVGELAGIPKSTFERRYKGHSPFTTDELDLLAQYFGVKAEELGGYTGRWQAAS